ncbi:MAG: NAD(+)/NADH kinase [Acidimicrobiia bacterium]|nr:NAD(+)/NADH kinase [Acidimicrobiia bacterium]
MTRVLVLVHLHRGEAVEVAKTVAEALRGDGDEVVMPREDAEVAGLGIFAVDDITAEPVDLVVAIGGDGTMLRAARLLGDAAPILGVNAGNLGYLTEVEPDDAVGAVRRFHRGDHRIEQRMRLEGEAEGARFLALNEVVIEKTGPGHTIRVSVSFDGSHFTTYEADGLIVATPTGSTAYNLSARGPIVDPEVRATILTPVSPHMLFDRSMVIGPEVSVQLSLEGYRPAVVSADGQRVAELDPGQSVTCRGSSAASFVRFGPRNFHGILKTKFQLPER